MSNENVKKFCARFAFGLLAHFWLVTFLVRSLFLYLSTYFEHWDDDDDDGGSPKSCNELLRGGMYYVKWHMFTRFGRLYAGTGTGQGVSDKLSRCKGSSKFATNSLPLVLLYNKVPTVKAEIPFQRNLIVKRKVVYVTRWTITRKHS